MKKVSIIYSGDYDFQVIAICPDMDTQEAMMVANSMSENGTFAKAGIDNYGVQEFDNIQEANIWIFEQVDEGRKTLHFHTTNEIRRQLENRGK